jgi:glycosyltransferase involved in cell wall biosynthesis
MHPQGTEKPRILILSTAYLPLIGGSELAIKHTTDQMGDFEFDMVTGRYTALMPLSETMGRIRVFRAGGRWARWTIILPKLLMPLAIAITAFRLMRAHRYVAVHAYQASQAAAAGTFLSMLFPRMPFIVTLQEGKDLGRQSWTTRMVRRWIVGRATSVTVISSYLGQIAKDLGARNVILVPNGVDVAEYTPPQGKPDNGHVVISISRLVAKNGLVNLIRAMPYVLEKTHAKLMLVGGGQMESELKSLASDLRVAGDVEFVGSVPQDKLTAYLWQADLFVRPSLSEGLGNAFLEAMAAKVPVVGSRVGGIVDFMEDGRTGLVCDPNDPKDIAEKIVRLLIDKELRNVVIQEAWQMVHDEYDWSEVSAKMDSVYRDIIK